MIETIFDITGSKDNFIMHIETLDAYEGSIMILPCDANGFEKGLLDPIFLDCKASLLGAICPSVIYNVQKYDTGTLYIKFKNEIDLQMIQDMNQKNNNRHDADRGTQISEERFKGEIANNGKDYLAFYNKTAVVRHVGHG